MPRRQRGRLRRLGRNGGRIGRLHNLGRADSDRLSAHLLKERDDRQNLIFGQTDRILVDVRHARRIFLRLPLMTEIQINVCLRLREAFVDKLPASVWRRCLSSRDNAPIRSARSNGTGRTGLC